MALILASASAIRRSMLADAGIDCIADPASIDEDALKANAASPAHAADKLARAKALAVARRRPDDWVIGSDSIVAIDDRAFDKPRNRAEAAEHLRFFSGKTMVLTSAVALAHGTAVHWAATDQSSLAVRPLSDRFIDSYLDREWPAVGACVGVFRMEGPGVQLFDRVDGSHFTILGMPLLPLLAALRDRGLLAS